MHDATSLADTGPVIVIVGPTASGKSAVADAVASRLRGEIISADSMQVYRGMDIGTAKTPPEERSVPYHMLDVVEPGAPYSAALFQRQARKAVSDILSRGSVPVVVGGTGLYVRALVDEMTFPPGEARSPVRKRIESHAAEVTPVELHARLRDIDPASAELIHPNNVRRVVRALEMAEQGASYADQAAGFASRRSIYDLRMFGLTMPRDELYRRIDERVDRMLAEGLPEEVSALLAAGYRNALTAAQAIGYKELTTVIEAGADLGVAVEDIKQASRRYAKRQLTWFRADPRVEWVDVAESAPEETAEVLIGLLVSA